MGLVLNALRKAVMRVLNSPCELQHAYFRKFLLCNQPLLQYHVTATLMFSVISQTSLCPKGYDKALSLFAAHLLPAPLV